MQFGAFRFRANLAHEDGAFERAARRLGNSSYVFHRHTIAENLFSEILIRQADQKLCLIPMRSVEKRSSRCIVAPMDKPHLRSDVQLPRSRLNTQPGGKACVR